MARYLVVANVSANDAGGSPMQYRKGAVVELTSAQVSALGASNFRLMNNPSNGVQTTTYPAGGGTSTLGVPAATPTHDTLGEAAGVSNSA